MHILLAGSVAVLLFSQASSPSVEGANSEIQGFLDRGWGFECHRSDRSPAIRAVYARHVEQARARAFLSSLPALDRLTVESSTFRSGDIRSLARECPLLTAIDIRASSYLGPPTLELELWPELFEFNGLKHLAIENLHCSDDAKWSSPRRTELETLAVSGNLSGMLPGLLASCKVRSLSIEFRSGKQELTATDHAALNSHTEIESLEILGDVFGGRMSVDLNALSELRRLRRLKLRQCRVDPLNLNRFPALQTLTLQGCQFVTHDFDTLLTHPTLEELTLWDYTNEELRITAPFAKAPKRLRTITLRFPVLAEISAFQSLPCVYDVALGYGGACGVTDKAHTIQYVGPDEIGLLEKLRQLRSVSVIGGAGIVVKVNAAAIVRLGRHETLRKLELVDADLIQDSPSRNRQQESGLETVRFEAVTPLRREFVTWFVGANTRRVFLGAFSDEAQAASLWDSTMRVSPTAVRLDGITLPVSPSGLESRLLTRSTEELVLSFCGVNKGGISQLVGKSPSLKRVTLDACSLQDERELLRLNEVADLKWLDFTNTTVSASTAQAMKAESVRFGTWPKRLCYTDERH